MTAQIFSFPARGPFSVRIEREDQTWLVICRDHGWQFADQRNAINEAKNVAAGFGVAVEMTPPPLHPTRSKRASLRARVPAIRLSSGKTRKSEGNISMTTKHNTNGNEAAPRRGSGKHPRRREGGNPLRQIPEIQCQQVGLLHRQRRGNARPPNILRIAFPGPDHGSNLSTSNSSIEKCTAW